MEPADLKDRCSCVLEACSGVVRRDRGMSVICWKPECIAFRGIVSPALNSSHAFPEALTVR